MNSQPQTASNNSNWDLLGELELFLNTDQKEVIHGWLSQTLEPLKLHEDLIRRVETSLLEATRRAQDAHTGKKMQHLHLRIHMPMERTSKGKAWGFFRVEKIEENSTDGQMPDHAIELFLYLEAH
jgi:hypothetical protein